MILAVVACLAVAAEGLLFFLPVMHVHRQRKQQRLRRAQRVAWMYWRQVGLLERMELFEAAQAARKQWYDRYLAETDLAVLKAYDKGAQLGYGGVTEPEQKADDA